MEKYNSAVLRLPVMNYTEEKKELGQKHVIPQINYCICKYQNFPHLSTYTKYLNSNVNFFFFWVERKFIKETKGNKADQNRLCYVTIQLHPSLTNPKDPQAGHGIKQKSYPGENLTEPKNQHKN